MKKQDVIAMIVDMEGLRQTLNIEAQLSDIAAICPEQNEERRKLIARWINALSTLIPDGPVALEEGGEG